VSYNYQTVMLTAVLAILIATLGCMAVSTLGYMAVEWIIKRLKRKRRILPPAQKFCPEFSSDVVSRREPLALSPSRRLAKKIRDVTGSPDSARGT
jgi:hypothetical protein